MENYRKAKPTPTDVAAAAKLKREWLARARMLKITQDTVADELGITQGAVSQYLNGKIPMNFRTLAVFCRLLGISDTDIRTDLPEQKLSIASSTGDADWADIEGYAQAMGLGEGPEAQEYAETHKLKFRAESLARKRLRPSALRVMYGKGDSMEPRVHSGDAILFDTSEVHPRDGAMFVILVPGAAAGEYQVKRCEILDDLVFFKADNPNGDHTWKKPKRMDNPRAPIKIIGRVRWIGSWEA